MEYHYDNSIHLVERPKSHYIFIRLFGLAHVISYIGGLIADYGHWNLAETILDSIVAILGLILLVNPRVLYKPWLSRYKKMLTLDNDILEWKLENKLQRLNLNEVRSISRNSGEFRFKTDAEEIFIVESHAIENKEKYEEFVTLMRSKTKELKRKEFTENVSLG